MVSDDPVWFKSEKKASTYLKFTKTTQQSGSISLDLSFLSTQSELNSEPVQLKK